MSYAWSAAKVELSDPINGRSSQQMAWHAIIKDRGKIKLDPSAGQLKEILQYS